MTPQMVEALHRISLFYAPEPEAVFREIAERVSEVYGGAMAMVNVVQGDRMLFRTVARPHPAFEKVDSQDLDTTLCQFALLSASPLLIQDASESPEFCHHLVVELKLRRYLGVPICSSSGGTVGTLCLLDDKVETRLGEADIQFLSLLSMRVGVELERERMMEERIAEQRAYSVRLEERLREQAEALKSAQEKLVEAAQLWAVGSVAIGVAHDIRNVLAAIQMELRAAGEASYPPGIARQWDRLYVLTHSLLALSDDLSELTTPIDIASVLRFVLKLLEGQAETDGIRLELRDGGFSPVVLGNTRRLEHLFVNLTVNALDAMASSGGTLTVTLQPEGNRVRVAVRDTGAAIAPEHLPHLFEPFFSTRANHTGLGLFSAKRIVEAHGGEIHVESEVDQGTCITVWLPSATEG